jgi:hypothetical protein
LAATVALSIVVVELVAVLEIGAARFTMELLSLRRLLALAASRIGRLAESASAALLALVRLLSLCGGSFLDTYHLPPSMGVLVVRSWSPPDK